MAAGRAAVFPVYQMAQMEEAPPGNVEGLNMARYVDIEPYEDCRIILVKEDVGFPCRDLPTADVAEVRHCEKCKYYRSVYCDEEYLYTVCLKFDIDSKPKDYCAWFELEGERRCTRE